MHSKQQNSLKLVCVGGGTGLSALLHGLKIYVGKGGDGSELIDMDGLSAIVSVSDDGGSTGRLIREFDVVPPGDIRKLLVSLSDADDLVASLFEYRFSSNGELGGHTVGNLLLIALTELIGSFPKAIQAASKLLAVRGRIIPASLNYSLLCAELYDGELVKGESLIPKRKNREPIRRVFLEPNGNGNGKCVANEEAISVIRSAEAIVIGPGSLYTSIMPNLAFKGISAAIRESSAMKIYICNLMSQPGETDGYSVSEHVEAIREHADFTPDYVVVNSGKVPDKLLRNYVQKELMEQLARITAYADEGRSMLKGEMFAKPEPILNLTRHISQVSEEIKQMVDPSKIQVTYDPKTDSVGDAQIVEADMVCNDIIEVDRGVKLNVVRHDPEKLARTLIKVLRQHPFLNENTNFTNSSISYVSTAL